MSSDRRWLIVPKVPRSSCSKFVCKRKPPPFQAAALARVEFYLHAITLAKVSAGRANSSVSTIAQVVGNFVVSRRAVVRHDNCATGLPVAAYAYGWISSVRVTIDVARASAAVVGSPVASPSTPPAWTWVVAERMASATVIIASVFHSVFCCSGRFLRWQH